MKENDEIWKDDGLVVKGGGRESEKRVVGGQHLNIDFGEGEEVRER